MNTRSVLHGIYGGLAGGLVMSAMLAMGGMLPMIGGMIGQPSAAAGFVVHMLISAAIGASFAVIFGGRSQQIAGALKHGLLYGGIWWVLGPLTLMPFFMGMGIHWNLAIFVEMLPGLVSHLLFGGIMGAGYGWLQRRSASQPAPLASMP